MGVGASPYYHYDIAKTVSGDIGYCFRKELTVYGGVTMFSQSSYLFSNELGDESKYEATGRERFTSFLLRSGVHHSLTLKTFKKNRKQWNYTRIGIFPEINGYFNPHLNRKYDTREGEKFKAPYSTQWAYGFGGGVFYGQWKLYVALKYECNTIDNMAALRQVIPELEKNSNYNHVVSLIFVIR